MLTLYYWPGASSVIPHITLEEIGAPYERKLIQLGEGGAQERRLFEDQSSWKGAGTSVDGNVLTESVAILTYLPKKFPDARLLPQNLSEEARCISTMAWFASAVHPTFAHFIRPERFATDTAAQVNMKRRPARHFGSTARKSMACSRARNGWGAGLVRMPAHGPFPGLDVVS
jgi:glutathione S-transferase